MPHRSLCLLPPPPRHRPQHRLPPLQLGASSSEPSRVASRVASQISGDDAAMEVSAADDGAESQLMLQPHQQMETCMYDDNDDDEEHNEDEAAMAETEAQD